MALTGRNTTAFILGTCPLPHASSGFRDSTRCPRHFAVRRLPVRAQNSVQSPKTVPPVLKSSSPALESAALAALGEPVPYSICPSHFPALSLRSRLHLLLPHSDAFDLRHLPLSYPTFLPPSSAIEQLPDAARSALPALAALAAAHALATGTTRVVGRFAVVAGTPCARLHADKLRLRSLATLAGPGTVLAPPWALSVGALGPGAALDPNASPVQHDALVLRDRGKDDKLVYCKEGDALFMRGSHVDDGAWEDAAVHRSPRLPAWRKRLVIQVDDFVGGTG